MEKIAPCCAVSRQSGSPALGLSQTPISVSTDTVRDDMALVPSGEYRIGTSHKKGFRSDGEGPVRKVTVDAFYIDVCAVTNTQFAGFVDATGYRTEAEQYGGSFVYSGFVPPRLARDVTQAVAATPWWWPIDGADWRHPEGPGSGADDRMDHPVVHVSWNDALAYSSWAGKRLPTEAEWEIAARGGLAQKTFPWGDELTPGGEHMCNIWQGTFPHHNTAEDGYAGTAPARSFVPNGYGLYNVSGNVWEWCSDWFSRRYHAQGPGHNPVGPPTGEARVIKGGSYMCHASYCNRYRMGARSATTPDSPAGHQGFRCASDA